VGDFIEKIGNILDFFNIDNDIEVPDIEPIPPVSLTSFLDDRIGMLVLQNDTVAVPKMYVIVIAGNPRHTKVHPLNDTIVSARYLYTYFHKINSFAPDNVTGNPLGNQWELKEVPKCILTYQDFELIKNNSRVYNDSGEWCLIDELEWLPWDCNANIKYRVNKTYTLNLIETINEGEGY